MHEPSGDEPIPAAPLPTGAGPGERQVPGRGSRVRWFPGNRRDGARLLSSSLVISVIGLVAWPHGIGRLVGLTAALLSLFWWLQYRQLRQ